MTRWQRFKARWVIEIDDAPLSRLDLADGLTDPRRTEYMNRYGLTGDVYDRLIAKGAIR